MVVLPVLDANRTTIDHVRDVRGHAIRRAAEHFGEVDGRVGVVSNPEQQDLPVELPHAADRALEPVRRHRQRVARYALGVGTQRRERERVVGSHRAR